MSHQSEDLRLALRSQDGPAKNATRRWVIPGAMLASLLALADCGPDSSGSGSSASTNLAAASATPPTASAGAASASAAPSAMAPACPKAPTPKCPAAGPPARAAAVASLTTPRLASSNRATADVSAAWSGGARRGWSHSHLGHRHGAYADRERRDWDLGRPWPGDRPRMGRRDYNGEGLTRGDRLANEHDRHEGLLGGPGAWRGEGRDFAARESDNGFRGGYRILRENSHGFASSQSSHFGSGERFVERYREDGHGAFEAYRRFSYAGVDGRGYLVWPGKVEY